MEPKNNAGSFCPDPNCIICVLSKAMGITPDAPTLDFNFFAEEIETALRGYERSILVKEKAAADGERALSKAAADDGSRALQRLILEMGRDEIVWLRARVKKYRALLAEEVGRRVVETERG